MALSDEQVEQLEAWIKEGETMLKQFEVAPLSPEDQKKYEPEVVEIKKKVQHARNVLLQDRVEKGL